MIKVEGLVYDYPSARALFGVNLHIAPGSVTALVGPNGAGKSTLLRCLAALERPLEGRVTIDGIDTAKRPRDVHARVGYLPDFYGLYDDLTVRRCLVYAALARNVPASRAEEAALRAAERVEITERLDQLAASLSRGLRQRLAIGQAIVHDPKVILLDEPASGLDPEARRGLSKLIRQLAADGATLIVSSHILAELEDYCDQMAVIRDGLVSGGGAVSRDVGDRRIVRVRFARPPTDLADRIRAAGGEAFGLVEADSSTARLSVDHGDDAAAKALAALIKAGLEVVEFTAEAATLESAYLAEINGGENAA
ncbi:MAG: ABC transporter ATP-binding protein [Maricaulaceae bacterium]|jgi:ABC-2 type transport system ATP-binding protein